MLDSKAIEVICNTVMFIVFVIGFVIVIAGWPPWFGKKDK